MRLVLDRLCRTLGVALWAALLAAACTSAPPTAPADFGATPRQGLGNSYRLGIGDKLKIVVFGEENLSGPVEVDAQGAVTLPLAGEVAAKGLTINELRDAIARKLSDGFLKNPRITIDMVSYRPIYLHGEVKNGGEFPFRSGLRIRDAIAMAGGYTYRADQSQAVIVREGASAVTVPLPNEHAVMPGDNIQIPERFF